MCWASRRGGSVVAWCAEQAEPGFSWPAGLERLGQNPRGQKYSVPKGDGDAWASSGARLAFHDLDVTLAGGRGGRPAHDEGVPGHRSPTRG